jgi:hypothetical protein
MSLYFGNERWRLVKDLENATLYFKKVTGMKVAQMGMDAWEDISSGTGYYDFADAGNIIRDSKTGKYFLIDTEFKSFQIPLPPLLEKTLKYAAKKFKYLNSMQCGGDKVMVSPFESAD